MYQHSSIDFCKLEWLLGKQDKSLFSKDFYRTVGRIHRFIGLQSNGTDNFYYFPLPVDVTERQDVINSLDIMGYTLSEDSL